MTTPDDSFAEPHDSHDPQHLAEKARDHLWMHFTRHSTYENGGDVPIIVRGDGAYIYDTHGKRYLEGHAGLFTVQVGHGRDELAEAAATAIADTRAAWERFAPHHALEATWGLIGATNAYLEAHAPWKLEPGDDVDAVMGDALEAIRLVAILITPAMPTVAEEIWRRIGLDATPTSEPFDVSATWGRYPGGTTVVKGTPLFPRIASDA